LPCVQAVGDIKRRRHGRAHIIGSLGPGRAVGDCREIKGQSNESDAPPQAGPEGLGWLQGDLYLWITPSKMPVTGHERRFWRHGLTLGLDSLNFFSCPLRSWRNWQTR